MKTALKFAKELLGPGCDNSVAFNEVAALIEARDREVRATALREAAGFMRGFAFGRDDLMRLTIVEGLLIGLTGNAERGEQV